MTFIEEVLIELLANFDYTQSAVERVLGLEMGTLSTDDPSPELLALMKVIRAYPWMLQVADKNFDDLEAKRILGHSAVDAAINAEILKARGSYPEK